MAVLHRFICTCKIGLHCSSNKIDIKSVLGLMKEQLSDKNVTTNLGVSSDTFQDTKQMYTRCTGYDPRNATLTITDHRPIHGTKMKRLKLQQPHDTKNTYSKATSFIYFSDIIAKLERKK